MHCARLAPQPHSRSCLAPRRRRGRPSHYLLTDPRSDLVASLADAIIPRTDTPSATDVGVPAFIDVIVAEYYGDEERAVFLSGLDLIGARLRRGDATSFAGLSAESQKALLDALD